MLELRSDDLQLFLIHYSFLCLFCIIIYGKYWIKNRLQKWLHIWLQKRLQTPPQKDSRLHSMFYNMPLENDDKYTKRHKIQDLCYNLTVYTVTRSRRYKAQYILWRTEWMTHIYIITTCTHNNISTCDLYSGNIYVSCKSQEWYLHCYMIYFSIK